MAKINLIIKGYMLLGPNFQSSYRRKPTLKVKLGQLKRMVMTPGSLRSRYLTSQTVGPLHSARRGFTESQKDFSFNDLSVSEEPPASPRLAVASPKPAKLPDAVDSLETAIDFVLALEHPCMAHIPFPADPGGDEPATHMMLVCAS